MVRQMNFGLQKRMLKSALGSKSRIETDMVDMDSLIDRSLSYHENEQNISRMLGIGRQESYGREPRARRGEFDQVGSSDPEIDKLLQAKPPGKRWVGSGKGRHSYTERRKNRSEYPGRRI